MKNRAGLISVFILFIFISTVPKKNNQTKCGRQCEIFQRSIETDRIPVILDTDPGVDDALAFLLAMNSPEIDLKAITVVAGNVTLKQGLENALKLVSLARQCNIPVAAGAQNPLAQKLVTAEFFHGQNGLGNVELPSPVCKADPRFAPDLIIEMVHKYPNQITLVVVGPETNIALSISKDPSIVRLVKKVVIMGGSVSGGNATAAAEANIFNDPEAARIVFNAGWPIVMVGLNVTEKTLFTPSHYTEFIKTHGPQNDFAAGILSYSLGISKQIGGTGMPMHDVLAMGVVIDPTFVTTQAMHVDIETRGELTRGETVANRQNSSDHRVFHGDHYVIDNIEKVEPNVQVAVEVDSERFIRLFMSCVSGK